MSQTPPEPAFATRVAGFPKARQGYSRAHVDEFVANTQRHVDRLHTDKVALTAEVARLSEQLRDTEAKYERIRTADLDERAQDILAAAEEQARQVVAEGQRVAAETVQQARREAEVIFERGRQELAWRRRRLAAERADIERQLHALTSVEESARPPEADPNAARPDAVSGREPDPETADELAREARLTAQQPG